MMLKLFEVVTWSRYYDSISTSYVVAANKAEAKKIVEKEILGMDGVKVTEIVEVDMSFPHRLCFLDNGQ